MPKKILVPIANGTEELEAVTVIDVLRRAEMDVTVASVQTLQVKCSRGVNLVADKLLEECLDISFDMIVLPGGIPGADNLRDSEALKSLLLEQKQSGKHYAAICAAPAVVFQPHGLLQEKKATCYPAFEEHLDDRSEAGARVVVDGNCITSQAAGTAMEFSLKIVELLDGKEKADAVAAAMLS
ncbi:MAG: DJ-1 family protein [Deltaproteobacteria bacterium]|nr:DJ-1 family protein [Deltaproteobacteria bacterium]